MTSKKNFFILTLSLLILLSGVSIYYSIYNALKDGGSADLYHIYHSTRLFLNKINPYEESGYIEFTVPPYSHGVFLIYSPIASLDYEFAKILWVLLNILTTIAILVIFSRFSKLTYAESILISLIFSCSLPFRVSIGNGQNSILILFVFCAFFIKNQNLKTFILGFSFVKYSFAVVTLFYLLIKYNLKYLIVSLFIIISSWLIFSLKINQNVIHTLFQPLQIISTSFAFGFERGDFLTILNNFNKPTSINSLNIINIFLCLCFGFFLSIIIKKASINNNNLLIVALLAIANLLIVPHIIYDYVFLLPSLFYSWKYKKSVFGIISISIIFYFWFGIKIIYYLNYYIFSFSELNPIPSITEKVINFIMLLMLFCSNLSLKKIK